MRNFGPSVVNYHEDRADGDFEWDVRYDLSFYGAFEVDLKVDLVGANPGATEVVWENGVNEIWNKKVFFSDGARLYEVKLDFQFVEAGEHQEVTVHTGSGHADMMNWYLKDPWGPDYYDQVAAHEVGHMLGNFDEYSGGATYNGYTRTGSLMSDVTVDQMDDYFWTVEHYAEEFGGSSLTTVAARVGKEISDKLVGTTRMDGFYGLAGADTIKAKGGNDYVDAGSGSDNLIGAGGSDILLGQAGNDIIFGGSGRDELTGGSGRDEFLFNDGWGQDIIKDFNSDADDIDLTRIADLARYSQITRSHNADGDAVAKVSGDSIVFEELAWDDLSRADFIL